MIDKFNRKINYARISLTSMCNLKCSYCSQYDGKKKNISLKFYETLIDSLDRMGIEKIRFTGGEPLLNPNIVKLVRYAKNKKNIKDIAITTNGILFDECLDELIDAGLNRINLSLDTINRETYINLTKEDKLEIVLKNISKAKNHGIKIKINTVLLKGITDVELKELLNFGYKNDIQIRFIELMPIGNNIEFYNEKYLSSENILKQLKCNRVESDKNDVAVYYNYKDNYSFGIISAVSNHFCNNCNRIRITSKGDLRLCLHSDDEYNLLQYKDDKEKMYNAIKEKIVFKPEKHFIKENEFAKGNMVQIGG